MLEALNPPKNPATQQKRAPQQDLPALSAGCTTSTAFLKTTSRQFGSKSWSTHPESLTHGLPQGRKIQLESNDLNPLRLSLVQRLPAVATSRGSRKAKACSEKSLL